MSHRILSGSSGANRQTVAIVLVSLAILVTGCNDDSTLTGLPVDTIGEKCDITPPAAPEQVQGSYLGALGAVRISWAENTTDPDLAGYILYRENGGDVEQLIGEPALVQLFQDGDVPSGVNRYCLRAVDLTGNESATCSTIVQIVSNPHGDEPVEF